MKRPPEERSAIHFGSGGEIGDYAFHEFQNSDSWFVEELPDGRARWEALPASHPLSMAWLRRPQAMAAMPPPLPRIKVPFLEKPGVRLTLIATIGVAFIGLISMGVRSTRAAEPPAAAAAAKPAPSIPAPPELLPPPAVAPSSFEQKLASLPTVKAKKTIARSHHKKHAKHGKRKLARR